MTFHGIFGLCSWYSPIVCNGRGSPGGPRRGSIVVSAPGGVPLRTLAAVALIPLLAFAAVGIVVLAMVPVSAEDALQHSLDHVGEGSDVYRWKCPTADGLGYTSEEFKMDIPEEDFLRIGDGALRQSTYLVPCPYVMVDPEDRYVRTVAWYLSDLTEGYDDVTRAQAVLNFVQCAIWYERDSDLFGAEDFWASPAETLYLHRGDCEDTSILLCSIYLAMGYRCAMLDFPGHVAVGVYLGDSEDYLFCETATDSAGRLGYGGSGCSEQPVVYGDFSGSILSDINGFFAAYRGLIRSVAGT